MTVPTSVESYLVRQSVRYDVIPHAHTSDSAHTAEAARVPGAVPPLGQAFGIETIVDESLFDRDEIYFECGDHCRVVHVTGRDFQKLMADASRGRFSHRIGMGVAELH